MVFFKTDTHPSDGQLIRHSRQKEESAGVKSRAADQASPTLDEVVRLTLTSANPAFTTDTPEEGEGQIKDRGSLVRPPPADNVKKAGRTGPPNFTLYRRY